MSMSHRSDQYCHVCNLRKWKGLRTLKEYPETPLVTLRLEGAKLNEWLPLRVHEGPCYPELKRILAAVFGSESGGEHWRGVQSCKALWFASVTGEPPGKPDVWEIP